jgi:prevent-host-death family protein
MVITIVIQLGAEMRTIKASEFKAKCLKIMDEVAATGEPVLITKNGVPITQLIPARHRPGTLFGALKGSILYMGDIISPIDEEWAAERE